MSLALTTSGAQHVRMRLWIVVVVALLAASSGFALAMALNLSTPGADAGDWLTAGAGAVGVVLTILAAVGIEEYRSNRPARVDRRRVAQVLDDLYLSRRAVIIGLLSWDNRPETTAAAIKFETNLVRAIARYRFVRDQVTITDPELWEKLEDLNRALASEEALLNDELAALARAGQNQAVYVINREKVREAALRLSDPIHDALIAAR